MFGVEETQIDDWNAKLLNQTNDSDELKNRVLQLESWKREIGVPAVAEAHKLQFELMEARENVKLQGLEMLALKQENDSLQIQLDTFEEEHYKWEREREYLLSQLAEISHERNTSKILEEHWATSVKEQYHKIDNLTIRHRRSSTDLLLSQRTISELLQENQVIGSANDVLKTLNNQNEERVNGLKQNMSDIQHKLADLQTKYDIETALFLAEKEKQQKMYSEIEQQQTKNDFYVIRESSIDAAEALPIEFNPQNCVEYVPDIVQVPSPRLSVQSRRSFDSLLSQTNDRIILNHIDFDEKHAFDIPDIPDIDPMFDFDKIRHEIEQELTNRFEKETMEINDNYETLTKQYQRLKLKFDNIQNHSKANYKLFEKQQCDAMEREKKGTSCWVFPWSLL